MDPLLAAAEYHGAPPVPYKKEKANSISVHERHKIAL